MVPNQLQLMRWCHRFAVRRIAAGKEIAGEPLHEIRRRLARLAADADGVSALCEHARRAADLAGSPRLRAGLLEGAVGGRLDLGARQLAGLEVDSQKAHLLLELPDDKVRVGGQAR